MPLKANIKFDAANIASKLPEPLRKPAGMTIQALMDLMGADDPLGGAYPTPLAAPAITLLSKGQMLNNLLNHVEDLKGTPYEKAAEALAEKSPHVLGSIGKIHPNSPPIYASFDKMPAGSAGVFFPNPVHEASGMIRKSFDVGEIGLNQDLLARAFSNPTRTLGHEVTHAAQTLAKGPHKFANLYDEELRNVGYTKNKYETGADQAGNNLVQALRGRRYLPNSPGSTRTRIEALLSKVGLK